MTKEELNKANLKVGGHYNWRQQEERLVYKGKYGAWHQFSLVGCTQVWCEALDDDLRMLEETNEDQG